MAVRRSLRAPVKLPGALGSLHLIEIDSGDHLMHLFEAMHNDPTAEQDGFCHLVGSMLEWWKKGGCLHVASCKETDAMHTRSTDLSMFVRDGFPWILPAFVAGEGQGRPIELLWVHSSLRRRGIGKAMVKLCPLSLPRQSTTLPRAQPFWKIFGI